MFNFGFFFAFLIASALASYAVEIQRFKANCKDKKVHTYRYSVNLADEVVADGWTNDEKFNSEWNFEYKGGNEISIDGKTYPISAKSGSCITISLPNEAPMGAGIWIYAINVELEKIVAAQVNASQSILNEIKSRSICFDCMFEFK